MRYLEILLLLAVICAFSQVGSAKKTIVLEKPFSLFTVEDLMQKGFVMNLVKSKLFGTQPVVYSNGVSNVQTP